MNNLLLLLLPYITIIPGLYIFHNLWMAMVSYHAAILLITVFGRKQFRFQKLVRGWSFSHSVVITLGCAANGFLVYYLWSFISQTGSDLANILAELGLNAGNWFLLILYYSLITPWLEEFFWRDLLPSRLKYPILSDVFFAGYHFFVLLLFIKPIFAFAAFLSLLAGAFNWRRLAVRLDGLLVPVLSHLVADFSTILAVYLLTH